MLQPFADEDFGSWSGRVAMRYRMGVGELAEQARINIDLGQASSGWLRQRSLAARRFGDSPSPLD